MTRARDVATQGGLVLLLSQTITNQSTITYSNLFSSAYDNYKLVYNNTANSTGMSLNFYLTTSGNSPANGNYISIDGTTFNSAANYTGRYVNEPFFFSMDVNGTFYGDSAVVDILLPYDDTKKTRYSGNWQFDNALNFHSFHLGGYYNGTTRFDGLKILSTAGTFSGMLQVYGYKK